VVGHREGHVRGWSRDGDCTGRCVVGACDSDFEHIARLPAGIVAELAGRGPARTEFDRCCLLDSAVDEKLDFLAPARVLCVLDCVADTERVASSHVSFQFCNRHLELRGGGRIATEPHRRAKRHEREQQQNEHHPDDGDARATARRQSPGSRLAQIRCRRTQPRQTCCQRRRTRLLLLVFGLFVFGVRGGPFLYQFCGHLGERERLRLTLHVEGELWLRQRERRVDDGHRNLPVRTGPNRVGNVPVVPCRHGDLLAGLDSRPDVFESAGDRRSGQRLRGVVGRVEDRPLEQHRRVVVTRGRDEPATVVDEFGLDCRPAVLEHRLGVVAVIAHEQLLGTRTRNESEIARNRRLVRVPKVCEKRRLLHVLLDDGRVGRPLGMNARAVVGVNVEPRHLTERRRRLSRAPSDVSTPLSVSLATERSIGAVLSRFLPRLSRHPSL